MTSIENSQIENSQIENSQVEYLTPYLGVPTFARRPLTQSLVKTAIAIVGIPWDSTVTNRPGSRFAPRTIREQSLAAAKYLDFGQFIWPWKFNPFQKVNVIDYGDITYLVSSQESMIKNVENHIGKIVEAKVIPIVLGGDHFVSYPVLKSLKKKKISLLHFDAHTDYVETVIKNHGSVFYHAVKEGIIDPSRSVQIGIRTDYSHSKLHVLDADQIMRQGVDWTLRQIKKIIGDNDVYISFDIDFLDPAYAPGTGTPEVGGVSTYFVRKLITGLTKLKIIGADLVEVSPPYDIVGAITSLAGAQIVLDILHLLADNLTHSQD